MHAVDSEARRVQEDPAYALAEAVGRELRQLPAPRAPQTLLPRVMAAVHDWTRRPWYAREWLTWPLGCQVASIAVLLLLGVGGVMLLSSTQAAAANAAFIVGRAILRSFAVYAFVPVALMCLACAGFGAALNHVAFGEPVHRL